MPVLEIRVTHTVLHPEVRCLGCCQRRLGQLELLCGVGSTDVVCTKEHQFASGKAVAERGKTQLVVVVVLSIDDDAVDVDTGVEYGQLTAGRQLPQTYTAVRRTGRHELVARRYARTQNLYVAQYPVPHVT